MLPRYHTGATVVCDVEYPNASQHLVNIKKEIVSLSHYKKTGQYSKDKILASLKSIANRSIISNAMYFIVPNMYTINESMEGKKIVFGLPLIRRKSA